MRDASVYIDVHPLEGEKIIIDKKEYTIGKIYRVFKSRRLYIQLLKDGMEINYPFHEVAKMLFDEGPHSIS